MKTQDFNRLISQIREENASDDLVGQAAAHVRERISGSSSAEDAGQKLRGCADFQSLIPAYLGAKLTPARTLLMEDHLHQCVECRHALEAARNKSVEALPRRAIETRSRPVLQWALAGALAAGIAIGIFAGNAGLLPGQHMTRATVASVDGSAFYVADNGSRLVPAGYKLSDGDEFRTGKDSRAEVQLSDGSQIEMDERSQVSISRGWRGTTIHLDGGHIIVQAAHRRTGRLYVATDDCLVSSKGTVFLVNHGTKGSRVSVLEGSVNLAYGNRSVDLKAGDQATSNSTVSKVPIQQDLAWSKDQTKYLELLGEFRLLQRQWEAIPGPGLRYQSDLLPYVPENTVVYAAIPNIGSTLGEAKRLFNERLQQSPVLREWWKQQSGHHNRELEELIGRLESFSSYLGDEVVLAVAKNGRDNYSALVLLADVRRPGLREFLEAENQELSHAAGQAPFKIINDNSLPQASAGSALLVYLTDKLMVVSPDPVEIRQTVARVQQQSGGFQATPFNQKITESYRDGAGWLFCVNMEQIVGNDVHNPKADEQLPPGFDNVQYLTIERRDVGKTETRASITFAEGRKGIAAWLAEPAQMGSLDFVSPEASVAASVVIKDPKSLVDEIFQFAGNSDPNFQEHLAEAESALGVSIRDDISAPLGGEVTFALDGPVLPSPSWKVIVEVYDRGSLQSTISKLIDSFNRQAKPEMGKLQLGQRQLGSQTYFTIRNDKRADFEVDYAFVDSYMIIGPNQSLIARAIQNRQAGYTLTRSQAFQSQMPTDGYTNFSAIFYHNLAPMVNPLAEQLKAMGALNADQQHELDVLRQNATPGMIYVYGEPDRIVVASSSGFMGLNLDTLLGVGEGNPGSLMHLFGAGISSPAN
jgi:hypothetical protein